MRSFSIFVVALLAYLQTSCVLSKIITDIENPSEIVSKQQLCNIISYQRYVKSSESCHARVGLGCEVAHNKKQECQSTINKWLCNEWKPELEGPAKSSNPDWELVRKYNTQVDKEFAEDCDKYIANEPDNDFVELIKNKVNTIPFCRKFVGELICGGTVKGYRGVCKAVARELHCK